MTAHGPEPGGADRHPDGHTPEDEDRTRRSREAESDLPANRDRLAIRIAVTRTYDPDRESMLAALRVALGLPRVATRRERDG